MGLLLTKIDLRCEACGCNKFNKGKDVKIMIDTFTGKKEIMELKDTYTCKKCGLELKEEFLQ